jgi:hypothetical protein
MVGEYDDLVFSGGKNYELKKYWFVFLFFIYMLFHIVKFLHKKYP